MWRTFGECCWVTSFYHSGSHEGFLFFRCPASFYNRPKKKNNTLSIRLTNNELDTININSRRLQMTNSEYLRSLIHNAVPAAVDYRQNIAPVICKIYVRLQELGLDEDDITKEVHALCQMLS